MKKLVIAILLLFLTIFGVWWYWGRKPEESALVKYTDSLLSSLEKTQQLTYQVNRQTIEQVISLYRGSRGSYPLSLNELVTSGYLDKIPVNPYGEDWDYDSETGTVE